MTDKLNTILEAAHAHAKDVILPNVDTWNAAKAWPRDASDQAGAAGLTGLYAPEDWGGQGLPLSEGIQVYEQLGLGDGAYAFALSMHNICTFAGCGYGTDAFKDTWARDLTSGRKLANFALTEPQSGSDVANSTMTATLDGDHYVLNGSKIWTTHAHHANWMFALVRTDRSGKPQTGITFLLIPMDTPGLRVDPIIFVSGEHEVNAVFFDDVRVPVSLRVGAENDGWTVAKYLLEFERGGQHFTIDLKKQLRKLRRLIGSEANAAAEDPTFVYRIAETEIDVMALEQTELRIKGTVAAGEHPGALSSLVKVSGTELGQQCAELLIEAAGQGAMPWQSEVLSPEYEGPTAAPEECVTTMAEYINSRSTTIYGGTAEIQRGIIAKHVLGL